MYLSLLFCHCYGKAGKHIPNAVIMIVTSQSNLGVRFKWRQNLGISPEPSFQLIDMSFLLIDADVRARARHSLGRTLHRSEITVRG